MDPTLCRKLFQCTESLALWGGDDKCQEQTKEVTMSCEVVRKNPSMSNSTLKLIQPCNPLEGYMKCQARFQAVGHISEQNKGVEFNNKTTQQVN